MTIGQTDRQAQKSSAEDAYIRLESEFSITPNQLKIQYKLTGKTETPLLVFDALQSMAQDDALKFDRHLAYVAFLEPSTLVVMRLIPPLPKRKDVESAYVPWAHKIYKNEIVLGDILVAIPAEESNPYYPPGDTAVFRKASANQLQLILQYAPLAGNLEARPVPDTNNLFQVRGTGAELREIALTIRLADKLAVKLRSDRFESLRVDVRR